MYAYNTYVITFSVVEVEVISSSGILDRTSSKRSRSSCSVTSQFSVVCRLFSFVRCVVRPVRTQYIDIVIVVIVYLICICVVFLSSRFCSRSRAFASRVAHYRTSAVSTFCIHSAFVLFKSFSRDDRSFVPPPYQFIHSRSTKIIILIDK